jgi:hypothetical protein
MRLTNFLFVLALAISFSPQQSDAGVIDFLFGAKKEKGTIGDCRNVFKRIADNRRFYKDETWKNRVVSERDADFLNDLQFLEETKYANATLGSVDTRFVPEFDTRLFYTSTAKARKDGTIPMVDPDAKALVIYFHGSGTAKASGVNFAGKMNTLAKLGYSVVSFDLPFHREGSRNPNLAKTAEFSAYLDKMIASLRQPGQKVILVGHSFGPDLISEYITRHPHGVDSAVLISPGSFDKTTAKWYTEKTSKMNFGDVEPNEAGGRWASMVTNESTWKKPDAPGRVDPTVANPKLKIHVVSGDREEYVPGKLNANGSPTADPREYDVEKVYKGYFKNVDVTIEPGVGHYIFAHQDAHGQDVVLRSILKANGEVLKDEKQLKKEVLAKVEANLTSVDQLANRYSKDIFFRKWLDDESKKNGVTSQLFIQNLVAETDKKTAQKTIQKYNNVEKQRLDVLNNNIKNTSNWAPAFYAENKAAIDEIGSKKGLDVTSIQAKYLTFLQSQPEEVVAKNARATHDVFVLPEKPEYKGPRPDQQNRKPTQEASH